IGENNFERCYRIACYPVAHAAKPTSIRRDVSADGRNLSAGRIWGKEHAVLCCSPSEVRVDNSGLYFSESIHWVYPVDAIHAFYGDDQSVRVSECTSAQACSSSAYRHRDVVVVGPLKRCRYFFCCLGKHRAQSRALAAIAGFVPTHAV